MPQDVSQDIVSIREWLAKESHLPTDFGNYPSNKWLGKYIGTYLRSIYIRLGFLTLQVYSSSNPYLGTYLHLSR